MKARLLAHLEVNASRWHIFHLSYLQVASPNICCRVRVVDHYRLAFRQSFQTDLHTLRRSFQIVIVHSGVIFEVVAPDR